MTLNVWKGVLLQQGLTLAKGLWCLLICSSMRQHNGYRGLHELVSGTRVIRPVVLEAMNELPAVPYYTSGAAEDIPPSIGPYDAVGRLGARGSVQILAARDEQLDRPVWVYVDESEISLSPERCHVARATRQRWLSAGTQGDSKWHAFEAIDGAPLPEAAMYATIPWRTARQIWLQTAEELEAALADGTLPERLTTEQIWVDTHCSAVASSSESWRPPRSRLYAIRTRRGAAQASARRSMVA